MASMTFKAMLLVNYFNTEFGKIEPMPDYNRRDTSSFSSNESIYSIFNAGHVANAITSLVYLIGGSVDIYSSIKQKLNLLLEQHKIGKELDDTFNRELAQTGYVLYKEEIEKCVNIEKLQEKFKNTSEVMFIIFGLTSIAQFKDVIMMAIPLASVKTNDNKDSISYTFLPIMKKDETSDSYSQIYKDTYDVYNGTFTYSELLKSSNLVIPLIERKKFDLIK